MSQAQPLRRSRGAEPRRQRARSQTARVERRPGVAQEQASVTDLQTRRRQRPPRTRQRPSRKTNGQPGRHVPLLTLGLGVAIGYGLAGPIPMLAGPMLAGLITAQTHLTGLINPLLVGNQRILVLGTDVVGANTDVMMTLQIHDGRTIVTQVPRDTFIESDRYGIVKANAIYGAGGIKATKEELAHLLKVPIERHLIVNLDAVLKLADALGGVEVDVPKRMAYIDNSQGLVIDLLPGRQLLRGRDLEGFLRYRHDELGDIGRMERQKQVLAQVFRKLAQPGTLPQLPGLLRQLGKDVETDLSPLEIGRVLTAMASTKLVTERLPGRPFWYRDLSYWMPDSNSSYAGQSGELEEELTPPS